MVDELGPFADLAVPASQAAGPFLEQTRLLVEETPPQLRQQRGLIKIAPPVIERLEPLLERLNPIADYLRIWAPETIGFFQNIADAAAGLRPQRAPDPDQHWPANVLPPPTIAGGALGPSDCGPGLLEAPYHRTPGVNECQPWDDWASTRIGDRRRRLMPDLLAKGVAVIVGVLLALAIGILVVTSRPPAGAGQVTAEFDNAFPLIEGMHVRVDGAIAGSVGDDRGQRSRQRGGQARPQRLDRAAARRCDGGDPPAGHDRRQLRRLRPRRLGQAAGRGRDRLHRLRDCPRPSSRRGSTICSTRSARASGPGSS